MPPNNPYAAPQTIHLAMAVDSPAPVLDEALLPVIHGAGICYRALMFLVGSIIGSAILWLVFMGGTDRYFLWLMTTGVYVSAAMHLWGIARMRAAPRESGAGWLLTPSFTSGLLFLMNQFLYSRVIDLNDWTPFIPAIRWVARLTSFGTIICLLLGIHWLGRFAKNYLIMFPCRWAIICFLMSCGIAIACELTLNYPELMELLGLAESALRESIVSGTGIALIILAMMLCLAFYAMALRQLMNLRQVLQAMQLETPPHLDRDESQPDTQLDA